MTDSTRFHFVVIAGRRSDFNDDIYKEQRKKRDKDKIRILHYDNLIDTATSTIGSNTY